MENEQNESYLYKTISFKGRVYTAVPETVEKGCQGCALTNRQCYNDKDLLKICRQGLIFVESHKAPEYIKNYKQHNNK